MVNRNGENVNLKDDNGWTPLHFAVQENNFEIVVLLLKSGADCNIQDIYGNAPLFTALFSSKGEGKIIQALLKVGADPYAKNKSGVNSFDLANQVTNYDYKKFFMANRSR